MTKGKGHRKRISTNTIEATIQEQAKAALDEYCKPHTPIELALLLGEAMGCHHMAMRFSMHELASEILMNVDAATEMMRDMSEKAIYMPEKKIIM